MEERPTIANEPVPVENRGNKVQVRRVRGETFRTVGVIGDDDIARSEVGHRANRRAAIEVDKAGNPDGARISEEAPFEIDQCGAEISGFLHVERAPSTLNRESGLLRDRGNLVIENFELNWIEAHCSYTNLLVRRSSAGP